MTENVVGGCKVGDFVNGYVVDLGKCCVIKVCYAKYVNDVADSYHIVNAVNYLEDLFKAVCVDEFKYVVNGEA